MCVYVPGAGTFYQASAFNQSLDGWDTSQVMNLESVWPMLPDGPN